MKTSHHILRTIIAVTLALLSSFLITCLGIVVYNTSQDAIGILSALFFMGMGLYIGYMVYTLVNNKGIDALGIFSSSPQAIDEIFDEDTGSEEERHISAEELSEAFRDGNNLFNGGEIRIWGECRTKGLQAYHELESISYAEHRLQLAFEDHKLLSIWNPGTIAETSDCLEIKQASRIRWEWISEKGKSYIDCKLNGHKINMLSSTSLGEQAFDKLLNEPALMIQ